MSDVPTQLREQVIAALTSWTEPQELASVLRRLDDVPHEGDDVTFIVVACEVIRAALDAAVRPRLERLQAEAAAAVAKNEALERECRAFRDFQFMKTDKTIH